MNSILSVYKIGKGPSSSHTMGPHRASLIFLNEIEKDKGKIRKIRAKLLGSLALTGEGHLTDVAIKEVFKDYDVEILFKKDERIDFHSNAMILEAMNEKDEILKNWEVYSVGGGEIVIKDDMTGIICKKENNDIDKDIYPFTKMKDILIHLKKTGKTIWEFIEDIEGKKIWDNLKIIWEAMKNEIERGIINEGVLPGKLALQRKASSYFVKASSYNGLLRKQTLIFSYALAVAEENAAGGMVVTAPTCGSSGVLPAVLYFLKKEMNFPEIKILKALATAGLIGKLVQTNASISGAEVGCQGEIGTACSMAAAAASQLMGGTPGQIEYAAEIALEHHLGLTCDPLQGYVQIPCIERNAFAASRAYDAAVYSILSDGNHKISFDSIVEIMKKTGKDLPYIYKETALGGIATIEDDEL